MKYFKIRIAFTWLRKMFKIKQDRLLLKNRKIKVPEGLLLSSVNKLKEI